MNNGFFLTEEILWDYADGLLSDADRLQVTAYLHQHPSYYAQLEAIQQQKTALVAQVRLESPRKGFSDAIMAKWVAEQSHAQVKAIEQQRDWRLWLAPLGFGAMLFVAIIGLIVGGFKNKIPAMQVEMPYKDQLPSVNISNDFWSQMANDSAIQLTVYFILTVILLKLADYFLLSRLRPAK